jgi:predicted acetyltransferase
MSLAYRAVPDDDAHRTAYRRLLQYAFTPEQGPDFDDDPRERPAEFEPRGLYERPAADEGADPTETTTGRPPTADADPSAIAVAGALVDFRMRLRGDWRRVGGVSAVASPPERRRRGHVGTLLDRMHEELRGRDVVVAALWPFSHPFYRQFGYGRANDYVSHEVPPEALDAPAATPTEAGTVRPLSDDDVDALAALHAESASEPLAVRRSADWWRLRIFDSWGGERYVYGWADDAGRLRSYLAYRIEEGDEDGRRLAVDYWGAADDEASRQLLGFLRNHDSQVATVRLVAPGTALLDRLADPEEVETTVEPGPMVRVVDVEAALSGLATPAADTDRTDETVVRVRDARYEWNEGRFAVGVADGRTTCRRIDGGTGGAGDGSEGGAGDADVAADVGALSRVVVGTRAASALAGLGHVAGDPEAVDRLDALLPTERPAPYLREFF